MPWLRTMHHQVLKQQNTAERARLQPVLVQTKCKRAPKGPFKTYDGYEPLALAQAEAESLVSPSRSA